MNREYLRTLAAVLDEGGFGAAADRLHLTPSAVSQRIKALEADTGQILVVRGRPCTPTASGEVLARMARQFEEIEADADAALEAEMARPLDIVVNADSLATWFRGVLPEAARWTDTQLRIQVEDEEYTRAVLQRGEAMAAVTTSRQAASGCRSRRLGVMRYLPVAAPALLAGRTPPPDLARLPVIEFNAKDVMQSRFLGSAGVQGLKPTESVRCHRLPSSEAFLAAVLAGMGWGLVPEAQALSHLDDGTLIRLNPRWRDVELYWQCWSVHTARLDRLTRAVLDAAGAQLR